MYKTIEAAQTEFDALGQGDIIVNSNNLKKSKNKKNKKISIDKNNQAHVQSTEGLAIANALLANADIDSGGNGYGTQAAIKAVNKMLINKGLVDSKTGKIIDDKARETINNLKLDQKYIDQFNGKADGILSGAIDYTGLTMLHGNPTHPEYVLNSDQAYTLLYNLSTKKLIPESNTDKKCGDTIYQFQGGITMNGVNDPEEFFKELTQAMGNRFNVTKNK